MHEYIITRGVKEEVDKWKNDMRSIFLPVTYNHPDPHAETGLKTQGQVRLEVRPIQLWEVIFPKEHLNLVNNILAPQVETIAGSTPLSKTMKMLTKGVRKTLGLKPIPKWEKLDVLPVVSQIPKWVAVHGIGIKEDKMSENGVELL